MSDWLDRIPSHEREKVRKRLRSPAEYERLREKVKGPEDLEKEMDRNEAMAELSFALETEPPLKEALKNQVQEDAKEQGIEAVFDGLDSASPEAVAALREGRFTLEVRSDAETHHDQLVAVPEGNVQEKIPVTHTFAESYAASLLR